MIIYVDVFFFLNFAVDFLCLYITKKILSLPLSLTRLFVGASLGGVWAILFLLFPMISLLNIPAACFMVFVAVGRKKLFGGIIVFLLLEALMGGVISALSSLFSFLPKSGIRFGAVILLSVFLVSSGEKVYEVLIKKKLLTTSVTATLEHRNKKKRVCLMVDSGNLARELTTGRRLIFVKEKSIREITGGMDVFLKREKIFAIPIKTASGSGIKYGFIPDGLNFNINKYNKKEFIVVPDLTDCEFGGYDGIVGVV